VFTAWTDAEGMRMWMCPGDVVSTIVQLDPRVGVSVRIVMRGPTGTFEHWGEFTAVDKPSKLAFTWHAKATGFQLTLVTVEFFETPDGHCDLVLTHERFGDSETRDQYRGGWGQILARLDAFLTNAR